MEIMTGTYEKTMFRNEKNGYTIFLFNTKDFPQYNDPKGYIHCTGIIPVYTKGVPLKLEGCFVQTKNEYLFEAANVAEYSDKRELTISYLSSDLFHGIGEKTAEKIVNFTGPDIFKFIKQKDAHILLSENIVELKGDKAINFIDVLKKVSVQKEIYDFIYPFGGHYANATKLYSKYGVDGLRFLKSNIYKVGMSVGLSFSTCDAIAKYHGVSLYDENRIEMLVRVAMDSLSSSGHTYSQLSDIRNMVKRYSRDSAFPAEIPDSLIVRAAHNSKKIVTESKSGIRYYTEQAWNNTNKIVSNLVRLQNSAQSLPFNEALIGDMESRYNIKYSKNQKKSFSFLEKSGVKILTGGPGTGKTTVINGLIGAYREMFPKNEIVLCAPTGRAAQRMSESTGYAASTIHRLLEIMPFESGTVCKDQDDPLTADLLVVDEMSMVDEEIFTMLVSAIKNGALVILCGDIDQLPSVGAGNVLRDLISSKQFEVNKLDVIYRQAKDSVIVQNSIKINSGNSDLTTSPDFEIIKVSTDNEMLQKIKNLSGIYYDKENPFAFQVLAPIKKSLVGARNINLELQKLCNPGKSEIQFGQLLFKHGDKIMMIRNNYDIGYFNGDTGIVLRASDSEIVVDINGNEKLIPVDYFDDIALSYAITIHKSQGAEYPIVIVALADDTNTMLKRNLLFTAVTRAKEKVIIVTKENAINIAIGSVDVTYRRTSLAEKLKTAC